MSDRETALHIVLDLKQPEI